MKKVLSIILTLALLVGITACGSSSNSATPDSSAVASTAGQSAAAVKPIRIGLITMDLSNEFFGNVVKGMKALEQQSNGMIKIDIADGKSSPDIQAQAFDNFLNAEEDIIMSSTLDPNSILASAKLALKKGIIVGTYPVMKDMTTSLTWDEYQWGYDLGDQAGQWIKSKLGGKATIACFYQAETPQALDRFNGYKEGVLAHCDAKDITFLTPVNAITPEPATTAIESIMQAHPECKVVLATAEAASVAAYNVLKANGKLTDDMFIGGCDGDESAMKLIAEGTPYRCSSAAKVFVSDLWYGFVMNAVRAYLKMDYVYNYPAPTVAIHTPEEAKEYLSATGKFIFDKDIADYFGITSVPIGSIGVNAYDSKTGKNPAVN
ncbi:MAG: sugar ABC transporter substrate-binding protein [Ruminiclostridium sp.]